MEKFKVGDVVLHKNTNELFEINTIGKNEHKEYYSLCGCFCVRDSEIRTATKAEVIKFYEDAIKNEKEKIRFHENKIKAEQSKLDAARDIVEEPVWPLPENTKHWSYFPSGRIQKEDGRLFKKPTNQALSEKRAKQLYEKARLMQDMYLWVDTFCPEWEPVFGSIVDKWGIRYLGDAGYFIDNWSGYNPFVFGISVPTRELADKMLAEFKTRLEEWY